MKCYKETHCVYVFFLSSLQTKNRYGVVVDIDWGCIPWLRRRQIVQTSNATVLSESYSVLCECTLVLIETTAVLNESTIIRSRMRTCNCNV